MSVHMLEALIGQYKTCEVSGEGNLTYVSAVNCVTPEIIIYGKCMQSGTPSPNAPVRIECNNNSYNLDGTVITAPELCGVGNAQDEYYPLTGKIVRRCSKMILSPWDISDSTYGNICFIFESENTNLSQNSSICSHFLNVSSSWGSSFNGTYGVYSDNNIAPRKYFRPPNESINTVEGFKAWLDSEKVAGRPVTLVYALAEPVIEYVAPISLTSKRGANTITESGSMANTKIGVKYLSHS